MMSGEGDKEPFWPDEEGDGAAEEEEEETEEEEEDEEEEDEEEGEDDDDDGNNPIPVAVRTRAKQSLVHRTLDELEVEFEEVYNDAAEFTNEDDRLFHDFLAGLNARETEPHLQGDVNIVGAAANQGTGEEEKGEEEEEDEEDEDFVVDPEELEADEEEREKDAELVRFLFENTDNLERLSKKPKRVRKKTGYRPVYGTVRAAQVAMQMKAAARAPPPVLPCAASPSTGILQGHPVHAPSSSTATPTPTIARAVAYPPEFKEFRRRLWEQAFLCSQLSIQLAALTCRSHRAEAPVIVQRIEGWLQYLCRWIPQGTNDREKSRSETVRQVLQRPPQSYEEVVGGMANEYAEETPSVFENPLTRRLQSFFEQVSAVPFPPVPTDARTELYSIAGCFNPELSAQMQTVLDVSFGTHRLNPNIMPRRKPGLAGRVPLWTAAEDALLALGISRFGQKFNLIHLNLLPTKTDKQVQHRYRNLKARRKENAPRTLTKNEIKMIKKLHELHGPQWHRLRSMCPTLKDVADGALAAACDSLMRQEEILKPLPLRENVTAIALNKRTDLVRHLDEDPDRIDLSDTDSEEDSETDVSGEPYDEDEDADYDTASLRDRHGGEGENQLEVGHHTGGVSDEWSIEEDKAILVGVREKGTSERTFSSIANSLGQKSSESVKQRYSWLLQQIMK